MPTTTQGEASRPPERFTLERTDRRHRLEYVGPSMWGYIYRARGESYCYRLISIEDVRDPEKRARIGGLVNAPRQPQMAPIVDADQCCIEDQIFFYVRYEVDPGRTWLEALKESDMAARLQAASRVLASYPNWSARQMGLLIMPADILFADQTPYFLNLPFLGWPTLEALTREPARVPYLAPEVIRGDPAQIWPENASLYAFGLTVLGALFQIEVRGEADVLLGKVANGTLFTGATMQPLLPFWAQRVDQLASLAESLTQTISLDPRKRSMANPGELARHTASSIDHLDPRKHISELRAAGQSQKALEVAQEILVDGASYDLLILAGEIAQEDLSRHLEAVSFYERAIRKEPKRAEAHEHQLRLLLGRTAQILVSYLLEQGLGLDVFERMDRMLDRDFNAIRVEQRKDVAAEVASWFNTRDRYQHAAKILYPYLKDGDHFLWWEFPKTLAYAASLIGMKRYRECAPWLKDIKLKLHKVKVERRIDPTQVASYQQEANRLELLLHEGLKDARD